MFRGALTPKQKHWWHVSLRVEADGLTTTVIPYEEKGFELLLDFTTHRLVIKTDGGKTQHIPLVNQSVATLGMKILVALGHEGIRPDIDNVIPDDTVPRHYDSKAAEQYWQALSRIDSVLKRFKFHLDSDTSPVQLWPHHFDLAMVWFTGRLVPGIDPKDEESADEQMNFGFSTGDEVIPDPYFYIIAYPLPENFAITALPADAYWHTRDWQGAVLPYEALVKVNYPEEKLFDFLERIQAAGVRSMIKR